MLSFKSRSLPFIPLLVVVAGAGLSSCTDDKDGAPANNQAPEEELELDAPSPSQGGASSDDSCPELPHVSLETYCDGKCPSLEDEYCEHWIIGTQITTGCGYTSFAHHGDVLDSWHGVYDSETGERVYASSVKNPFDPADGQLCAIGQTAGTKPECASWEPMTCEAYRRDGVERPSTFGKGGYGQLAPWSGPVSPMIDSGGTGHPSERFSGDNMCVDGTTSASSDGYGGFLWEVAGDLGPYPDGNTKATGSGLHIEVDKLIDTPLTVVLGNLSGNASDSWMARVPASGEGVIPWEDFEVGYGTAEEVASTGGAGGAGGANAQGTPFDPSQDRFSAIMVLALPEPSGDAYLATDFNFCVIDLSPAD